MDRDAALDTVFKPVRPPTTFEETVERLGTAIRLGLLPAGSKLPAERNLAARLRISRSTLRQALTTLVQSGQPLGDDAWAVLDYRVAIETGATILAAERADDEQLDVLDALVKGMSEVQDFEDYRRADIRFHIGVAEAARSPG